MTHAATAAAGTVTTTTTTTPSSSTATTGTGSSDATSSGPAATGSSSTRSGSSSRRPNRPPRQRHAGDRPNRPPRRPPRRRRPRPPRRHRRDDHAGIDRDDHAGHHLGAVVERPPAPGLPAPYRGSRPGDPLVPRHRDHGHRGGDRGCGGRARQGPAGRGAARPRPRLQPLPRRRRVGPGRAGDDGRPVPVSPLLFTALEVASAVAARTAGVVDPTVGSALVDLGYDRDFDALQPDRPAGRPPCPAPGWWQLGLDAESRSVLESPRGVHVDLECDRQGARRRTCRLCASWRPPAGVPR